MTGTNRGSLPGSTRHRCGFVATTTAIVLIGLASVALTAVVAATVADVRRTRRLELDAQFRELLLAGAADAAEHAKSWGEAPAPQSWDLALPAALAERGYRVHLAVEPSNGTAGAVEVRVDVESPSTNRHQELQFTRTGGRWTLSG